MFPRFLMSETMQKVGLVTFNAWALDGYLKVFWYGAPVQALWPQVAVLSGLAVVFLCGARIVARQVGGGVGSLLASGGSLLAARKSFQILFVRLRSECLRAASREKRAAFPTKIPS